MTKFNIEIWSDTSCPWSYIGKKSLDRAIAEYTAVHPDAEFELEWKPFYLYPSAKASGMRLCLLLGGPRRGQQDLLLCEPTQRPSGCSRSCYERSEGTERKHHQGVL